VLILFWICLVALFWTYFLFPATLVGHVLLRRLLSRRRPRHAAGSRLPAATVLLAVRNGASELEDRVRNLLAQDYPADLLDVIVICNGSGEDGERRARALAASEPRVRVLTTPAEAGKAGALNAGAAAATGEVLVFADVRQRFGRRAVRHLVRALRDPAVGGVSGRLRIGSAGVPVVRGVVHYWQLETQLRLAESLSGSVVGATGAIYAVRRSLFRPLPPAVILDDVYLPMMVIAQGYRMTLNLRAVAWDRPSTGYRAEYARRLRTLVGNYELLRHLPWLLSPRRNPIFVRYVSHKLLRALTPAFCLGLLVSGLLLPQPYHSMADALLVAYALGALGLIAPLPILALPSAFVLLHSAGFAALLRPYRRAAHVWAK